MLDQRCFRIFSLTLALGASAGCDGGADEGQADATADALAADALPSSCPVPRVTLTHGPGTPAVAHVHKLDLVAHPDARCNDGSAGTFVFRPGFGGGRKRWHIYLEGGGSCGYAEECAGRYAGRRSLMSSDHVIDGQVITTDFTGIKSSDAGENPDFYDANLVQLHYCSSDQWSGEAAAVPGAPLEQMTHWHFRGRAIAAAVFEELNGLGLDQAEEVLFTGSSAGGLGVGNQADDLRARLPRSIRMLALQDAGFGLLYPPYDPITMKERTARPFPQELEYTAGTLAWGGRGDLDCEAVATPGRCAS